MIDQKLYNAINENNKKEHAKWVKREKRKSKIDTILIIIGTIAVLSLILVLGNTIKQENTKALKNCLKNGYSQKYCLRNL